MSTAAPAHYLWWLAGRAAGIVALGLITASVLLGLAMAARALPARWRRGAVRAHQHLALVSLAAIAAHGLLLAPDPWLKPGLEGIAVPFALAYRPLWTGLGIIAGYLAAIFALSFYVRRMIGPRTWRRLHRFTVLAYVLALAHALGSGTDAAIPAVRYALLASALPAVALFAVRAARPRPRGRAPSSGAIATPRCVAAVPGALHEAPVAVAGRGTPARHPTGRLQPTPSQVT